MRFSPPVRPHPDYHTTTRRGEAGVLRGARGTGHEGTEIRKQDRNRKTEIPSKVSSSSFNMFQG